MGIVKKKIVPSPGVDSTHIRAALTFDDPAAKRETDAKC
jgi:hypothetical protein